MLAKLISIELSKLKFIGHMSIRSQHKDDVNVDHPRADVAYSLGKYSVVICSRGVSSSGSDSLNSIA